MLQWKLPEEPTHNATINSVTMHLYGQPSDIGEWKWSWSDWEWYWEWSYRWDAGSQERTIEVYDMESSFGEQPTWNNSTTWSSGSFSNADYNNTYTVDNISLSSSVEGEEIDFNVTGAMWGSDRNPVWGESCQLVLVGSGYKGSDSNKHLDRFGSSETNPQDNRNVINGGRPMLRVNYSIAPDTYEYTWVDPLSGTYPDSDQKQVENGSWTINVSSSSALPETFALRTYIDKKSATKIASSAFLTSFNDSQGDRVGLVLYSNTSSNYTNNQSSYIRNGSQWVGYFKVDNYNEGNYSFELSWEDNSTMDLQLYEGIDIINSTSGNSSPVSVSETIESSQNYKLVIEKKSGDINDSAFDINVTSSDVDNITIDWEIWSAKTESTLKNDTYHLENAVNTMTCEGLTAIDEGIYVANNELENITGNSTMVLMTDGIDNAGSHSLLEQAQRARDQNTVIYTVGFGSSESEVDPVLEQIANITGGEYYFAPNSTVLEDIFVGIASDITNFSATGPKLELHIPHNYITNLSIATATYQDNSSNSTIGNNSTFVKPSYPSNVTDSSEPDIENIGDRDVLRWDLPPTMGMGDKWGVWYQLRVQGAGTVPLILPTSTLSYTDINGTSINISISYSGDTSIGGSGASVDYVSLGDVNIEPQSDIINISDNDPVTITARYSDGNPAIANALLYTNLGGFGGSQYPFNLTVSGSETVNFSSSTAGNAFMYSFASNGNNSVSDSAKIYVRPKGSITLN
ncbi:VWA domain-containing protein [Methanohalophilus sp. RSK]|uniref:vWA domain-containing protein n=1 Tax=Methanohalophilus sp. RSK TaxID=2485783 RepID=UPI000F439A0F|nr:VWA domain-containing protein [Methanohalophilus sp. RSK]RNI14562.1 VWA domain-containing protein [Methanohalophilus sp. RSK]